MPDVELTEQLGLDTERFVVLSQVGQENNLVYCCLDKSLNRKVAIKLLSGQSWNASRLIEFQMEAKVHSVLSHPNIVGILDFRVSNHDKPYIVMEYVRGSSLETRIKDNGYLSELQAAEIVHQIALGMQHAHEKRIIHRDLKPSNILLRDSNLLEVLIIDFGIARGGAQEKTHTYIGNQFSGTPAYISPEQILGKPTDGRADIYSLGCVYFEALTGIPPFQGQTPYELFQKHIEEEVPALSEASSDIQFSSDTEEFIAKCLEKEPEDRFQSMSEVLLKLSENMAKLAERGGVVESADKSVVDSEQLNSIDSNEKPRASKSRMRVVGVCILMAVIGFVPILAKWTGSFMREPEMSKMTDDLVVRRWAHKKGLFTDDGPAPDLNMFGGASRRNRSGQGNRFLRHFEGLRKKRQGRLRVFGAEPNNSLSLRGRRLTDMDLVSATQSPLLKQLFLKDCTNVTAGFLHQVAELSQLNSLSLENCTLDKNAFSEIARMRGLRTLLLRGAKCRFSECLGQLSNSRLVNLDLSNTTINRAGVDQVASMQTLECLSLQNSPGVPLASLERLKKLPRLRVLEVTQVKDSKTFFEGLSHIGNLEELCVSDTTLNGIGGSLKRFNRLQSLNVSKSRPSIEGLKELSALAVLLTLQFEECKLPADFARAISSCHLKELSIRKSTGLVSSNLMPLSAMSTLKSLDIASFKIDDAVLDDLKKALPGCEVKCATISNRFDVGVPPMDIND